MELDNFLEVTSFNFSSTFKSSVRFLPAIYIFYPYFWMHSYLEQNLFFTFENFLCVTLEGFSFAHIIVIQIARCTSDVKRPVIKIWSLLIDIFKKYIYIHKYYFQWASTVQWLMVQFSFALMTWPMKFLKLKSKFFARVA